jgi:hypothetical protein
MEQFGRVGGMVKEIGEDGDLGFRSTPKRNFLFRRESRWLHEDRTTSIFL